MNATTLENKVCVVCGNEFVGTDEDRTCSPECSEKEILENTILLQQQQANSIVGMANSIARMYKDANKIGREIKAIGTQVQEFKSEIDEFKQVFHEQNRLLPAEVDDLYRKVCERSIELTKQLAIEDGEESKKMVGKLRSKIWRKHNRAFAVSKYIHLPRKRFEEALDYIQAIRLTDFV